MDWKKSLKNLRKTGANLIEESEHALFCEMYLAHNSVAKRHYLKDGKTMKQFDDAIVWLGQQFDIE